MKYDSNKIAFYFFMGVEIIAAAGMVVYTIILEFLTEIDTKIS